MPAIPKTALPRGREEPAVVPLNERPATEPVLHCARCMCVYLPEEFGPGIPRCAHCSEEPQKMTKKELEVIRFGKKK